MMTETIPLKSTVDVLKQEGYGQTLGTDCTVSFFPPCCFAVHEG